MIKNLFKAKCPNCKSIFTDKIVRGYKVYKCTNCNCSLKISNLYIIGEIFITFLGAFLGAIISGKIISRNNTSEKFISALIIAFIMGLLVFIYTAFYPKKLSIKNKN